MSDITYTGKDVQSLLMRQTLLDRDLVKVVDRPVTRLLPDLHIVLLGGRSIIDRGGEVVSSLVAELRAAMGSHQLLVLAGPGVRARHAQAVGLDLGLPTGVLAALASTEAEQNGGLIAALLAADGVSYVGHGTAAHQLATHLAAVPLVVSNGYPPFGLHEVPPAAGKLPVHGADAGAVLLGDSYGAAQVILVKDVDGICTADPAEDASATLLPRVSADELRALPSSPVEPVLADLLSRARHLREVQLVNGLVPGNLSRALKGDHVGTLLHA
jgi:molybdenum storage protein